MNQQESKLKSNYGYQPISSEEEDILATEKLRKAEEKRRQLLLENQKISVVNNQNNSRANNDGNLWSEWLGLHTLYELTVDGWLLVFSKAIRLFSYGFLAVMLVLYLESVNLTIQEIGMLLTLTLLGDAVISILLTTHADRWGRKRTLIVGSALAISTSFIFAFPDIFVSPDHRFPLLLIAGILGVISPSGNEIGPFMAIEISALTEVLRHPSHRTALMAWYNLFGSFAAASGALFCGCTLSFFEDSWHFSELRSCRMILILYGLVQIGQLILFLRLSPAIEPNHEYDSSSSNAKQIELTEPKKEASEATAMASSSKGLSGFLGLNESAYIVLRLSLLFFLDSFAGSLVFQSLIAIWFDLTYKTSPVLVGNILFLCNILAGISALAAIPIAAKIGLLMTMFVTHLPSNILLALIPCMPNVKTAIILLGLRFSISQMDVPTRNAYIQGIIPSKERSAANGVINVTRSVAASIGPYISTIMLFSAVFRNYPFYIAGILKIVYDILILISFQGTSSTSDVHNSGKVTQGPGAETVTVAGSYGSIGQNKQQSQGSQV